MIIYCILNDFVSIELNIKNYLLKLDNDTKNNRHL
jgi:hypothetical protein